MHLNFKIVVAYDGTDFSGWQRQKGVMTVQESLEGVLSRILNQKIRIQGSGRTDAGVHAWGQVANFHADTGIGPAAIKKAVNSMIQGPIVIRDCTVVPVSFHAQYHARSKEYHYVILNREDPCPINRLFQWHIREPLDVDLMNQCCDILVGVHDFRSFENAGSPRSSTVRKINASGIDHPDLEHLVFKIRANGFLKNMVRNLVGTLVLVGQKKMSTEQFKNILEAKDRRLAGPNAPPHGLFLKQVYYG